MNKFEKESTAEEIRTHDCLFIKVLRNIPADGECKRSQVVV